MGAMRVIGLMSGTSADGMDAALVEWPAGPAVRPFDLLGYQETPIPPDLRAEIHAMAAGQRPSERILRDLLRLDQLLGELFAEAARGVARAAGIELEQVDAIASHGQTIAHHPEVGGSLQIGNPALIAERTERPVVADFRPGDLAAGGEGAPLAPFFHHAVLAEPSETRVVLNLGGMANLTFLPRGGRPEEVLAFDVGPANSLIDGLVSELTAGKERMDRDGCRASRGQVDDAFLDRLLADEYFERSPPKSTGRERYGPQKVFDILSDWQRRGVGSEDDLIATVSALTVETVARACLQLIPEAQAGAPRVERLIVGGGGAFNAVLMNGLKQALPGVMIDNMDDHGVPAAAAEAMAFSLMGRNALRGEINHLPLCTGARGPRVLGVRIGV
ncbi:anhydro-N-acetylmuramic acid kinase [Myxococcota bacterium]|nr:anhydro-N-acetylmuramic acid kinase [Myxococcota bacterium]